MKILLETGQWSDYIPGGLISGTSSFCERTPEEEEQIRKAIVEMIRDFIKRTPDKAGEFDSFISMQDL